jgi:anaerobic selenocysteine-containing dehydrogenase
MGERDASQAGIGHGDGVKIVSSAGEVTAVARITDGLPEGMLFLPVSFPSTPVNRLFEMALDPQAKTPAIKACSVRLERV